MTKKCFSKFVFWLEIDVQTDISYDMNSPLVVIRIIKLITNLFFSADPNETFYCSRKLCNGDSCKMFPEACLEKKGSPITPIPVCVTL